MGEIICGNGLGYDVVFSLLKEFLDQGFSLYIDNYIWAFQTDLIW